MTDMPGQALQEEFLSTVRKSQETVIEAIKTWVDTIQSLTPRLPSIQAPVADKLPSPEELVANAYDFAEQLLASQRKFAEEVLRATTPLLPGNGHSAPKTPAAK